MPCSAYPDNCIACTGDYTLLSGGRRAALLGVQRELLDTPIEDFAYVELIFRRARHLVNPAELLQLLSSLAEHADHFPVERHLVDTTRVSIRHVQKLVRARVD